ncbi:MAG: tryptophan-rich sensory protein [Hyphomicrobiaceae bacterium]|nr:tryptophan-rich sensory protein [Hyphomicrobiaceae bacterium]
MSGVLYRARPVLAAAALAMFVAVLGGTLTDTGPWYQSLAKPALQPPDWSFGVVWTLLFALVATAGVIAWNAARDRREREWIFALFSLNGFLNVLWSLLFFQARRPDWAMIEVVLLWISILVLMVFLARISRTASLLLLPYLGWVGLAAYLNFEIVRLNGPFEAV